MRKLNDAVDRFAYSHPRFGIPNLMKVIVIGNVVAFFLIRFAGLGALDFLSFNWAKVLSGEIWRLVTFVFVPESNQLFMLAISLYFYYFIGNILEREWGTPKFNLYYFFGMALTVLTAVIAALASGSNVTLSGTYYVNMSMFFAFAMLFPDTQVLLFFFIPVKMKWLAWADAALFAVDILGSAFRLD
ncbi:MAG: rhomboid family intramembrane serine protease, partial [Oscillibacter sp.]